MVTLPQAGLPFEPRIMKAIEDRNEGCLGVVAEVVIPGVISSLDEGNIA